jgi:hypothetical protein
MTQVPGSMLAEADIRSGGCYTQRQPFEAANPSCSRCLKRTSGKPITTTTTPSSLVTGPNVTDTVTTAETAPQLLPAVDAIPVATIVRRSQRPLKQSNDIGKDVAVAALPVLTAPPAPTHLAGVQHTRVPVAIPLSGQQSLQHMVRCEANIAVPAIPVACFQATSGSLSNSPVPTAALIEQKLWDGRGGSVPLVTPITRRSLVAQWLGCVLQTLHSINVVELLEGVPCPVSLNLHTNWKGYESILFCGKCVSNYH